ncbi:MAG: OPT/YSL family transporter [Polyangiaceae bacterium]
MSEATTSSPSREGSAKRGLLPPIGSVKYHLLLGAVAIFILGPLGGITAAYMNFSLGFFVGGQVLAGILGSVVTYGYGPEGKHGANYMQTMAASVASMAAMGVLTQAMVWIGMPAPEVWKLILYFLCIGMFGVGVGMLYTPMLVDRMQLTYPSGLAVANILRALTDKKLLKRSVGQLGAGTGVGFGGTLLLEKVEALAAVAKLQFSASTVGAGMVVGARVTIPAVVVGVVGELLTPFLRSKGLLGPEDPFRKVGFLVALGTIMGAAVVDISIILYTAFKRLRDKRVEADAEQGAYRTAADGEPQTPQNMSSTRLFAWVGFWALAVLVVGTRVMHVPIHFMLFVVALSFLFVMVNGISLGISDSNPISSAFVVSIVLMTLIGLKDGGTGLLAGSVLLVSTSVACDMQQDRSTGWRLGSNRITQFRYQVIGVTMGAVCAVVITKLFMDAYPLLSVNQFTNHDVKIEQWQSAMTYKFVGAVEGITHPDSRKTKLLLGGLCFGFLIEVARKFLKASEKYKAFKVSGENGYVVDFLVDAVLLPSPYASSFGGFVNFATAMWFGVGGAFSSAYNELEDRRRAKKKAPAESAGPEPNAKEEQALPEDMSTTSLVGGGLIGGESLAALVIGVLGLLATLGGK